MKTVFLPKLNSKKEANIITVTNAKIEGIVEGPVSNGVSVKVNEEGSAVYSLPAELLGYSQYESLAEFVADCGNEEKALELVNDFKRDSALNDAKVILRTTTNVDTDSVVASAIKSALDHTFSGANKMSGSEAKNIVNDLRATVGNLPPDEALEKIKKMLGL